MFAGVFVIAFLLSAFLHRAAIAGVNNFMTKPKEKSAVEWVEDNCSDTSLFASNHYRHAIAFVAAIQLNAKKAGMLEAAKLCIPVNVRSDNKDIELGIRLGCDSCYRAILTAAENKTSL